MTQLPKASASQNDIAPTDLKRNVYVIIALAVVLVLGMVFQLWGKIPENWQHFFITFAVVVFVHLLDRIWLFKDMTDLYGKLIDRFTYVHSQALTDVTQKSKEYLEQTLQDSNEMIASAAKCGLGNFYPSRKEAIAEVGDAINNASKKIWILAIALSEYFTLNETMRKSLKRKMAEGVSVKILLLNPYRQPAVFRCFLETESEKIDDILNANRHDPSDDDPLFDQELYRAFNSSIRTLKTDKDFRKAVRFYTDTPSCWLVITDDVAYYQPYTLGRPNSENLSSTLFGALMPVSKYCDGIKNHPYQILVDHFLKLWRTSMVDFYHLNGQAINRINLVKDIISTKKPFLLNAAWMLKNLQDTAADDRRSYPRQLCRSNFSNLSMNWEGARPIKATVVDHSYGGLLIMSEGSEMPKVGMDVILNGLVSTDPVAKNLIDQMLRHGNKFIVCHAELREGRSVIGIAVKEE